jgi:PilZ domain
LASTPETGADVVTDRLVHLALPVRWSVIGQERGPAGMACTYDIHAHGARLVSALPQGAQEIRPGDLLMVERGRHKAICQVLWSADPDSPLRGQFSVQCVEGKTPWDEELRQAQPHIEEQYQPVILDAMERRRSSSFARTESNRRRRPRFYVEGQAEVIDGVQRVEGEVKQISEYGARISAGELLKPGTDFRLMLNMFDVSVAVKAQVKYLADNLGMGVEFQEIRRGDRPLLSYVLSRIRSRRVEEFAAVEVVSEPLIAAAG